MRALALPVVSFLNTLSTSIDEHITVVAVGYPIGAADRAVVISTSHECVTCEIICLTFPVVSFLNTLSASIDEHITVVAICDTIGAADRCVVISAGHECVTCDIICLALPVVSFFNTLSASLDEHVTVVAIGDPIGAADRAVVGSAGHQCVTGDIICLTLPLVSYLNILSTSSDVHGTDAAIRIPISATNRIVDESTCLSSTPGTVSFPSKSHQH